MRKYIEAIILTVLVATAALVIAYVCVSNDNRIESQRISLEEDCKKLNLKYGDWVTAKSGFYKGVTLVSVAHLSQNQTIMTNPVGNTNLTLYFECKNLIKVANPFVPLFINPKKEI